jgi:hypothetical protein
MPLRCRCRAGYRCRRAPRYPCYDIHDFVEHVDWGNCRIEVPPSVIGNDDPVQSVPYRELGIRGDAVWLKLVINLASGPLSILALSTARQVYESAPCLDAARRSREEAVAIVRKMGCDVAKGDDAQLPVFATGSHKSSIVQDLERGRPMEIDTLYEIPLALARNIGVATPTLDLVGSEARLHFDSDRTPRAAQLPDLPRGREREAVVEKEILRNARSAHAPEYAGAAHTMRLSGNSGISRTSANDSENAPRTSLRSIKRQCLRSSRTVWRHGRPSLRSVHPDSVRIDLGREMSCSANVLWRSLDPRAVSIEEVLADRLVSWAMTRSMCAPISDGSGALVGSPTLFLARLTGRERSRRVELAWRPARGRRTLSTMSRASPHSVRTRWQAWGRRMSRSWRFTTRRRSRRFFRARTRA